MLEKILGTLNRVPCDKVKHFAIGSLIFGITSIFLSPINSFIILFIIATLKEVYDFYHENHTSEFWDFFSTIAGCFPVIINIIFK